MYVNCREAPSQERTVWWEPGTQRGARWVLLSGRDQSWGPQDGAAWSLGIAGHPAPFSLQLGRVLTTEAVDRDGEKPTYSCFDGMSFTENVYEKINRERKRGYLEPVIK